MVEKFGELKSSKQGDLTNGMAVGEKSGTSTINWYVLVYAETIILSISSAYIIIIILQDELCKKRIRAAGSKYARAISTTGTHKEDA